MNVTSTLFISLFLFCILCLLVGCTYIKIDDRVYEKDTTQFFKWILVKESLPDCSDGRTATATDILEINKLVQENITYEADVEDYWQSPLTTSLRGKGDCEDLAILKYAYLGAIGQYDNELVIVLKRNNGVAHAVLRVFTEDTTYILDNKILTEEQFNKLYQPVYAINTCGWRSF